MIDSLNSPYKDLPVKAQQIYKVSYVNSLKEYGNHETALKIADIALKLKFDNVNDQWIEKSIYLPNYQHFEMYITKAVSTDNEMTFHSTASDTGWDLRGEKTSIKLFKSFIDKLDGSEYVSLAHYPSLDGKAELGKPTDFYLDGEKFKSKGKLYNTPLGIASYNAIRKDRRENTPLEKRVRISIGFWDYEHKHGNEGNWNCKSGIPCLLCAQGIGEKEYLDGKLNHLALTRIPARITTSINVD